MNYDTDFPVELVGYCEVFWSPPEYEDGVDVFESAIITAFFDLRRSDWKGTAGEPSQYRRSFDDYFDWFGRLARLKNAFLVFTEPEFAPRVLEARRSHGMENRTQIVVVPRLFDAEPVARAAAAAGERMTSRFRSWLLHPEYPEFREPRYAVLTALKAAFVNTALRLGLTKAQQVAWIDFGYCRDDERFDPAKPWRFDAGEHINLFCIAEPDNRPISAVVRYGQPYLQGGHIVGPSRAWPNFAEELARAFDALLACDLVDDEQTLMLMALRRDPSRYTLRAVSRDDWRVVFRNFNCDVPLSTVKLTSMRGDSSSRGEELRIAMKRLEWRVKRWRARLGFP